MVHKSERNEHDKGEVDTILHGGDWGKVVGKAFEEGGKIEAKKRHWDLKRPQGRGEGV